MLEDLKIPASRAMHPSTRAARKAALLAALDAADHSRRRRWFVVPAAGVAVALAAGGAALYIAERQPAQSNVIRCYAVAELSRDGYTELAKAAPAGAAGQQDIRDPVTACGDLFRQGFLQAGKKGLNSDPDQFVVHAVPQLAACVLDSGQIAVFPGGPDTCRSLGVSKLAE